MKAIMIMYDSLNLHFLNPYGCQWTHTPNFNRLAERSVKFNNAYVGSMPCMPARRELHTGRYNFLHRSWGPMEPFDDSMPEILKRNGVHSHLATDHYHYFEDGGATYHQRYATWEGFRGQEGDPWKGVLAFDVPENRNGGPWRIENGLIAQDFINRSYMHSEDQMPQSQTFEAGLEFINNNFDKENWFLQIETFDPHEPFFVLEDYLKLYADDYEGAIYDWPEYRPLDEADDAKSVRHIRNCYAALLSMCDAYLGRVLDAMDKYNLWEDTLLIVNTDHGHLLSEHGLWAKSYCPFYNEIAHTPLFIWDPRVCKSGVACDALVQTIDLPASILEYFDIALPIDMQGVPLRHAMETGQSPRALALFGIFGEHVNCTDGRYVYMRGPVNQNQPLYQYTLMPTRHGTRNGFFSLSELKTAQMHKCFTFTKGVPLMRTTPETHVNHKTHPTMLFDLQSDPTQQSPISNPEIESQMIEKLKQAMAQNDAPPEQFHRLGL